MKIVLSSSSLKAFWRCPAYFHRRYVLCKDSGSSLALEFGTAIHCALEAHYLGKDWRPALDEAYSSSQILQEVSGRCDKDHARTLMKAYLKHWAGESLKCKRTEFKHEMEIAPGIWYGGTIDMEITYNGVDMLADHKTGYYNNFAQTCEPNIQPVGYVMLAQDMGLAVDSLLWNGLQTAHKKVETDPAACFSRNIVAVPAEKIAALKESIRCAGEKILDNLESGRWAQHEGEACNMYNKRCEFADVCMAPSSLRSTLLANMPETKDDSHFRVDT